MIKNIKKIYIVEVTVEGKYSPARTAEIVRIRQRANSHGASVRYVIDDENGEAAIIGFNSKDPDLLCVMLNN